VANWYCRVLRPGRALQQRLMMLESIAMFDEIMAHLRDQGPPPRWLDGSLPELAVPAGPISHW